jgi:hypothetical protein
MRPSFASARCDIVPVQDYHTPEQYEEAFEALNGIAGAMRFEFNQHGEGHRDTIIRNFIARSLMMGRAVFKLYRLEDYHDCWILHRCLLNRLFHLEHLAKSNEFAAFEAWSFWRQYMSVEAVRADPEFRQAATGRFFETTPEQDARASELRKQPPVWHRPKAEAVARRLKMHFLYKYGYDFGSSHVHPMANDGDRDFYTTRLPVPWEYPDQRVVLSNTLLVVTMIVQTGMNATTLRWRSVVYDFLEEVRAFLGAGQEVYKVTFLKLGTALQSGFTLAALQDAG